MQERPRLGAIVLAGGRSSRMGTSKALLDWHGGTLVRRVTGILQRVADPVVVVHADGQELPPLPGVERRSTGHRIAARWRASPPGCALWLAAVRPCSSPAPTCRSCTRPGRGAGRGACRHDAAVPVADGHVHHLCAVYRCDLLPEVEQLLAGDRLRVGLLLEAIDVLRLDVAELPHPESLRNLNTEDSYRQALAEPQPQITLPTGSVRAATLGEAARLAPDLVHALPGRTLVLNGAAIEPDPATPLVEGDVLELA